MPDVVARVIELLHDERTNARELVQLVTLIAHYSDGKPVTRAVTMKLDAPNMLPVGFMQMGPEDRAAVIADLRQRALSGELGSHEGDEDDED